MMKLWNKNDHYFDKTIILLNMAQGKDEKLDGATMCWLCNQLFTLSTLVISMKGKYSGKIKDHCHLTGRYRVAAQNTCIINAKQLNFIPLVLPYLTVYDTHVFCKDLVARKNTKDQLGVIPKTNESFKSNRNWSLKFFMILWGFAMKVRFFIRQSKPGSFNSNKKMN